jgi:hypothetical protein
LDFNYSGGSRSLYRFGLRIFPFTVIGAEPFIKLGLSSALTGVGNDWRTDAWTSLSEKAHTALRVPEESARVDTLPLEAS